MEDFITDNFTLYEYNSHYINHPGIYNSSSLLIQFVATCTIICVALLSTLVVIYALFCLVRCAVVIDGSKESRLHDTDSSGFQVGNDHVAPIYIVNLLMSNVVHLCCLIVRMTQPEIWMTSQTGYFILHLSLVASVWFMVCVALERYLVIACPLWYNSRRKIMISVLVCVVVWILALDFVFILYFRVDIHDKGTVFGVFILLPLPLFIFFLGGTLKALSASRVPSDEKRRIVGILVLVLFIYMLLFLPFIVYLLVEEARYNDTFRTLSIVFLRLTPVAHLTLYVFMKKGTIDKLLSSVCCCTMDSSEISSSPV